MPFTPFHFGPGLAFKSLAPRHFSLTSFTLTNVLMDLEPLYRLYQDSYPLHGYTHTLAGAFIIGTGAGLLAKPSTNLAWRTYSWLTKEPTESVVSSYRALMISAYIGAFSHVLLDGIMHEDMRPFFPLTDANPLLHHAWLYPLHFACVLAGLFGMALYLARSLCDMNTQHE
jgi:membrane-bound metal-dependent hydrolase YbcI (DUF457 family)